MMKLRLTPKQQLWANVFCCAVKRSNLYLAENNLDRHAREHTTVVLALRQGDEFWTEIL
jgi:hypothetical protein